jgi:hypothetical protein
VVEAALNNRAEHHTECLLKHYGIQPLTERLALPSKPTLPETFLASVSIFIGDDVELGDKLTFGASDEVRDDYAELVTKWEIQRLLWERLWYCADCDSVFDPETRQHTSSHQMRQLLHL